MAALQKINQGLQPGNMVLAADVRNLTPTQLGRVCLGGEEVLRNLTQMLETELERDWGKESGG